MKNVKDLKIGTALRRIVRVVIPVLVFFVAQPAPVQAQSSHSTIGIYGGYVNNNKGAEAGVFFNYAFKEHLRIGSDVGIVFRNNDRSGMLVDINAHVPFSIGRFEVYPLAGVNYSSWNLHFIDGEGVDGKERYNRFGMNAGAGAAMMVSSTLRLGIEGCYTWVKHNDTGRVRLSIGYLF